MEFLQFCINVFLHLDKHLDTIITNYGTWTYLILFTIVFCETGFVITPFLPGDSLLFAVGALAATGSALSLPLAIALLCVAAILGDTVNYWIGNYMGPKVFSQKMRLIKKEHLDKTHQFFEKYGGKTIILARFVPIIRTFAPFVAGAGSMTYGKFILYNIIGGIAWVTLLSLAGFFFGNIPFVKKNFSMVVIAIIVISLLPIFIEYWKHSRESKKKTQAAK